MIGYAAIRRLRLIDFLVDHYGTVQRSALMDYYGISRPQASADIKKYMELAPGNMNYDKSAKAYVKCDSFSRVWK